MDVARDAQNTSAVKVELLDAHLLRTLGATSSGGADIGECLPTTARVRGVDLDSWHDEWTRTAKRVLTHADAAERRRDRIAARSSWIKLFPHHWCDVDADHQGMRHWPRALRRRRTAFGAALLSTPPELLEIPDEGMTLSVYSFRVVDDGRPGRRSF